MNTALLLIDVQKAFEDPSWGERNNANAEENMGLLLNAWREQGLPVIHVKHNSTQRNSTLRPDAPGNEIQDFAKPLADELLLEKNVNSAFIGTDLEAHLKTSDIRSLVIVGLTTDHCVSTSVRMAANLGFDVRLVEDGTATFERTGHDGSHIKADQMHKINLASLNGEFCSVVKTQSVIDGLNQ